MFNILIVSHGSVAESFCGTAEMIMGEIENIRTAGIQPGVSSQEFGEKIEKLADEIYNDNGLLVLTDLYGGTPCNVSIMNLLNKYSKVQIISGLNLPILLEALGSRSSSLEEVTDKLIKVGKEGIIDVNKIVSENSAHEDDE